MTPARKTALLPRRSEKERSVKRYDASAGVQAATPNPIQAGVARLCDYPPCGKSYIPRRSDHAHHSAKCRNAHWFEKKFISLEPAKAAKPGDRVYIQGEVGKRGVVLAGHVLLEVRILDSDLSYLVVYVYERSLLRAKTK